MSAADGEKFVIRDVFENVQSMAIGGRMDGKIEYHHSVPWRIRITRSQNFLNVYLDCPLADGTEEWSIDTSTTGKLIRNPIPPNNFSCNWVFRRDKNNLHYQMYNWNQCGCVVVNGSLTFEFSVKINKMTGNIPIEKPKPMKIRHFDDDAAKELSDITLIVGNQKFYVNKMYLSLHCTYFKSMILGNFQESGKSEIELNDVDPGDFQNFLDLIYGDALINEGTFQRILKLADFFDSKTAIKRCEEFLIERSKQPLKIKFEAAIKYKMDELKTKCISEMKTVNDLRSIVPDEGVEFGESVWKELFLKSLSFNK